MFRPKGLDRAAHYRSGSALLCRLRTRHAILSASAATARPPALGSHVLRQAPELPASEPPEGEGFDGRDTDSESEPAAVEPYRSAQGWGDVARAPCAPALPAPVRLRGGKRGQRQNGNPTQTSVVS